MPVAPRAVRSAAATLLTLVTTVLACSAETPPSRGQTMKKGSLSPQALWDGAYVVVGGTIHDLRQPNGPFVLGTLRPAVLFRGATLPTDPALRLYAPELEGRSAIWMLRTTDSGLLTEEYPWMRAGPETFLAWPADVRDRALDKLPHARTDGADGRHLYIIRAPSAASESLLVWIALVEDSDRTEAAAAPNATLRASGATSKTWALRVPSDAQSTSSYGSVRVLENPGSTLPQQIAVGGARGAVRLEASLEVPGQGSVRTVLDLGP